MDDLRGLHAGALKGLALGDNGFRVQIGLAEHLLHLFFCRGDILLPGADQLLGLLDLQGHTAADLREDIQSLVTVDGASFGAEGGAFGFVDHAVEHVQQALQIFFFHTISSRFSI